MIALVLLARNLTLEDVPASVIHIAVTGLVGAIVIRHPGPTSRGETPTSWVCAEGTKGHVDEPGP